MKINSLSGAWEFRQAETKEWLPATVPGGVHTDLLALKRIPDPFVGDNEKAVMWVAEADWEYRRSFAASADLLKESRVFLVCDGLDTLAEVYLNGKRLGNTENMFRQYRWDVKSLLKADGNEIQIKFSSTVCKGYELQAKSPLLGVEQALKGSAHMRKAPCQYGWDWGPMLPPTGIWRDIRLEGYSAARIEAVHLRQSHADGKVTVSAAVSLERWEKQPLKVSMTLAAPDGTVTQVSGTTPDGSLSLAKEIANPELWWPNGYGKQPLYRVEISVSEGEKLLDKKQYRLGLRTIELRRKPDQWGESFTFVVNAVPIFAKGSDWIPADSFPTRVTRQWYSGLLKSAVDSHQNMLRVWGGGIYESEDFYDLCDELGLLIWQDHIFACSIYPLNAPDFVENLKAETFENTQRLRHRACLALWCGNNEMEQGWASWGWARLDNEAEILELIKSVPAFSFLETMVNGRKLLENWKELKDAYDRYFHHTLPQWMAELDPDTAYWPSSPSSWEPFNDPNSQLKGDVHYWDVWHGRKPFTAYRDQFPRFMSEFGFQALPPLETIKTYAEPADWNMTSYIMEHHQRNASGNGLMIGQMSDTFRMPKDFSALVYLSMVLQAEGIRYGVEHWRRNCDRVSGTLYWQLNDCWPVASWSSLDYFGRWKALHYAAKRFYAPVLLSIEDKPGKMSVYVTNDLLAEWQGEVRWSLENLEGKRLEEGSQAVNAAPQAAARVCGLDFGKYATEQSKRDLVFVCELWQGSQRQALQVAAFVPSKHLNLSEPQLECSLEANGMQLAITVKAGSLARFVELAFQGADVVFNDNYFDLPAGRAVTVTCDLPENWTLDQARKAFRVRSLFDSF